MRKMLRESHCAAAASLESGMTVAKGSKQKMEQGSIFLLGL
jgi:hypothetical protein